MNGLDALLTLANGAEPAERQVVRAKSEPTSAGHEFEWTNHGNCVGQDLQDAFYPVVSDMDPYPEWAMEFPNAVCTGCPVFAECQSYAVMNEPHGIWAKTDPLARRRMRKALGLGGYASRDPLEEPPPPEDPEDDL